MRSRSTPCTPSLQGRGLPQPERGPRRGWRSTRLHPGGPAPPTCAPFAHPPPRTFRRMRATLYRAPTTRQAPCRALSVNHTGTPGRGRRYPPVLQVGRLQPAAAPCSGADAPEEGQRGPEPRSFRHEEPCPCYYTSLSTLALVSPFGWFIVPPSWSGSFSRSCTVPPPRVPALFQIEWPMCSCLVSSRPPPQWGTGPTNPSERVRPSAGLQTAHVRS